VIVIWAVLGPIYHYSDTCSSSSHRHHHRDLPVVFLIQNTQNRDAKAIQLKLDELIRGVQGARTGLVRLEELSDEELKELECSFERLRSRVTPARTAGES